MSGKADQQAIVERLLSISGEDALSIDRKYLPAWTGTLPTRFLLLSNELPRLSDASGAIASRFILLMMKASFLGKEKTDLTSELLAERKGILNWALDGLDRLRKRGHFVQPDSSAEPMRELADLASPVGAFVRECCIVSPYRSVGVDDLFAEWGKWCSEQGRDHTGNKNSFGRDLRAVVPELGRRKLRDGDERFGVYEGIGLR